MKLNKFSIAWAIGSFLFGYYFFYQSQAWQSTTVSPRDTASVESSTAVVQSSAASPAQYRGPLDDCLQNSFIYARTGQIDSDCTLNYVHFYPSPGFKNTNTVKRPKGELKIGSFNLFHLGDNQAPLKNLELIAQIMNRWDIVAGQEFMPLSTDVAANNSLLANRLQDEKLKLIEFPYENWRVVGPGYLRLLEELQKLDSSWGLILQSSPAGEGTSGEMAGFFYRSSLVNLKQWDYCPAERSMDIKKNNSAPNYACLVQVTPDRQKLISRTAFAAYFQSGNFDFVGLTSHVRFRPADTAAELKSQIDEICLGYTGAKKCSLPKDTVGRFYEVLAVADQIDSIKQKANDLDVIYMGDFNLELQANNVLYWLAALKKVPGMTVIQTEPSTISLPGKKLASNYDHFILDPKLTAECDVKSAHTYKIPLATSATADPVLKNMVSYFSAKTQDLWVAKNIANLDSLLRFQDKGTSPVRPLTEKEINDFKNSYAQSRKRMDASVFAASMELISDHIPIEMNCRTDLPDQN